MPGKAAGALRKLKRYLASFTHKIRCFSVKNLLTSSFGVSYTPS